MQSSDVPQDGKYSREVEEAADAAVAAALERRAGYGNYGNCKLLQTVQSTLLSC